MVQPTTENGLPTSEMKNSRALSQRIWKVGSYRLSIQNVIIAITTGPITYALVLPIAFLDLCVTIFQAICFRIWRVPRAKRADFIQIDRHKLQYLNGLQKVNCVYCGYANGTIAYVRDVASRTEKYWCPIKHEVAPRSPHERYSEFQEYNDRTAWNHWIEQFE